MRPAIALIASLIFPLLGSVACRGSAASHEQKDAAPAEMASAPHDAQQDQDDRPCHGIACTQIPLEAAKGAFSCDFELPGDMPLDRIPAIIERDRIYMAEQGGMLIKRLPIAVTQEPFRLYSGGRYLFESHSAAQSYLQFLKTGYVLDETPFLQREIFISPQCYAWKVVGVAQFQGPEKQIVMRTERWQAQSRSELEAFSAKAWPSLKKTAEDAGLSALWMSYDPDSLLLQWVYFSPMAESTHAEEAQGRSMRLMMERPSLMDALGQDEGFTPAFDRTHFLLTTWYPYVEGDRGQPSDWPFSKLLPAPSCGDGLCTPSRGESFETCPTDCPQTCGNLSCDGDESPLNCPSDCRL